MRVDPNSFNGKYNLPKMFVNNKLFVLVSKIFTMIKEAFSPHSNSQPVPNQNASEIRSDPDILGIPPQYLYFPRGNPKPFDPERARQEFIDRFSR